MSSKQKFSFTGGPWSDPLPIGSSKFEIHASGMHQFPGEIQKKASPQVCVVNRLEDAYVISMVPQFVDFAERVAKHFEGANTPLGDMANHLIKAVKRLA